MMMQTSKGKVPHTYNELIKVAAIKVTPKQSGIEYCDHWKKNKNNSDISHVSGGFWDNVTDFIDEPVVQSDVPVLKNTSLLEGDSDDCK